MAFGNILSGFSNRMVQDIVAEREARRKAEDADIDYQMEIINNLTKNPNINPNILNRAISDLAALNSAKTPGARKSKGSMYGGSEVPVSQLIQSIASGIMPMQGPTTEQVQRPVGEQIEMTRGAELQPFNPQSLPQIKPGGMDGMDTVVPPAPLGPPPMITPLQRAAKQAEMKTQLLPPEKQPLFRSPDEMAAEEGRAAGLRAGAIRGAQKQADLDAWIEAGGSPEEFRKLQLTGMRGGTALRTQYDDAGYFNVNGKIIKGVRKEMPDGSFQTVDAVSGLPLPPGAEASFAPRPDGPERVGTPDQQALDAFVAAAEAKAGRPLTPQEKSAAIEQWQTADANRRRPVTNINMSSTPVAGSVLTPKDRPIFNSIVGNYQRSPLVRAKDRTITLKSNIDAITRDPSNAAAQLALGYSFVQALDTYQSAVREGELRNLNLIDSRLGQLQLSAQQMVNGQLMRPEVAKQIAQAAALLYQAISSGATAKANEFRSQAYANGNTIGAAWDAFTSGSSLPENAGAARPAGAPGQKKSLSGFIKGSGVQP